jgi:uncharacterized membrane protein
LADTEKERNQVGELLLFVHIVAVGSWLGAGVTRFVVTPAMQKIGGSPAAAWMRQTVRLGTTVSTPAAVVLLITGFWMVLRDSLYEFEQTFVVIGTLMVILGAVLGMRIFGPGGREAADLHEAGETAAADKVHQRLARFGAIDTLLLVFTIWAMVTRLGL